MIDEPLAINNNRCDYPSRLERVLQAIIWPEDNAKYKEYYEEVISLIKSGRKCGLFIGAGLSVGVYPDLKGLTRSVAEECAVTLTEEELNNILNIAPEILERCMSGSEQIYFNKLNNIFDPIKADISQNALKDVLDINLSKGSYITTNIDVCLLRVAERKGGINLYYYPNVLDATEYNNGNIYYIHGIVVNAIGNNCIRGSVLTTSQYNAAYLDDGRVKLFLRTILEASSMIFIGFSLQEEPIKRILKAVKESNEELRSKASEQGQTIEASKHYLFLPAERVMGKGGEKEIIKKELEQEIEYLKSFGVRIIRFTKVGEDYQQLKAILNNLVIQSKKEVIA